MTACPRASPICPSSGPMIMQASSASSNIKPEKRAQGGLNQAKTLPTNGSPHNDDFRRSLVERCARGILPEKKLAETIFKR